jgi:PIN domain nuclease of toxin-antitoxin system
MNLLLDTHAFIWWDSEPAKLSAQVLELCQDSRNTLLLSVAGVWEMQIKLQLGKLKLKLSPARLLKANDRKQYSGFANNTRTRANIGRAPCSP